MAFFKGIHKIVLNFIWNYNTSINKNRKYFCFKSKMSMGWVVRSLQHHVFNPSGGQGWRRVVVVEKLFTSHPSFISQLALFSHSFFSAMNLPAIHFFFFFCRSLPGLFPKPCIYSCSFCCFYLALPQLASFYFYSELLILFQVCAGMIIYW